MWQEVTGLREGRRYLVESQSETVDVLMAWSAMMPSADEGVLSIPPGQARPFGLIRDSSRNDSLWLRTVNGTATVVVYEAAP